MDIAVIPARGGSKRLPGKNVRPFCGRPVIEYPIAEALASGCFDRVIVSTDDEGIAEVSRAAGAEVPFVRPPELSDDHTPTVPVVRHAIEWARRETGRVDNVCCLYATAPFVRRAYIREGIERLRAEPRAEFAFAVTTFAFPIFRALEVDEASGGRVKMLWPEHELTRSQDLPEAYHDAGQFYWGSAAAFLGCDRIYSGYSLPVVVPRYLVQDIDTEEDWVRAELMFKALGGGAG